MMEPLFSNNSESLQLAKILKTDIFSTTDTLMVVS